MKAALTFGILAAMIVAASALAGHLDFVSSGALGVISAMAVQTAYNVNQPVGYPGQPANMNTYTADSLICETVAGIGFGLAVSQGANYNGCVLGGASAAVFRGLTVRDVTLAANVVPDKFADGDTISVMFRGDMWVTVGADVTAGQDVTFSSTTGVLSSAAASGSQFTIAGARWMTSATSGNVAIVRLSGNVPAA